MPRVRTCQHFRDCILCTNYIFFTKTFEWVEWTSIYVSSTSFKVHCEVNCKAILFTWYTGIKIIKNAVLEGKFGDGWKLPFWKTCHHHMAPIDEGYKRKRYSLYKMLHAALECNLTPWRWKEKPYLFNWFDVRYQGSGASKGHWAGHCWYKNSSITEWSTYDFLIKMSKEAVNSIFFNVIGLCYLKKYRYNDFVSNGEKIPCLMQRRFFLKQYKVTFH